MTTLSHLECSECHKTAEVGRVSGLCECGGPLLARYNLEKARQNWHRGWIGNGPSTMWRYSPVLPVSRGEAFLSLGEGFTPLVRALKVGRKLGCANLWIKDEGVNPTGSFKARGMACALSMALELGVRKVAVASAGNAASAMAAYAATAGLEAHIFMPADASPSRYVECRALGARVTRVEGPIIECARLVDEGAAREGWLNVGALREPYRIEGKKTLGYEIAEQLHWRLPEAIVCPTGNGAGLIGMWKAFEEMERLGWISSQRPKMIAVQAVGCAPVVRAWEEGQERTRIWEDARTIASSLRVAEPLGGRLILEVVRQSGGTAVAVSDEEMLAAGMELGSTEGMFAAPEGAACVAAIRELLSADLLKPEERIVMMNTGAGLKYLETYATRFPRYGTGEADKLGGLITPR